MLNTALLTPANFITIGLISVIFTMLVTMAYNTIHNQGDN